MKPKQWAEKCMDALDQNSPDCSVSETITLYIEKAVDEERERCAKTVASPSLRMKRDGCDPTCHDAMAAKIRNF